MTLTPIGGQPTPRELVELAINNPLPNIDDLPPRSEFDITQTQLETELDDIAATQSDIRPVMRTRRSAVAVSESQTAMDAVAASTTAMDAVAASTTAMDAVAASKTAIDAVIASQLALDTVAASQTAMDAVSASQTAMDAVSASQTAMDAVATSTTAMDAVSASQTAMDRVSDSATALGPFLASTDVTTSFWSNSTGTEAFWDHNGDLAAGQFDLSTDSRFGGQALFIDCNSMPFSGDTITWTIDLDSVSTLTVAEKTLSVRGTNFEIIVNGSTVFSANNDNTTFIERSFDVSAEGANSTIEVGLAGKDSDGRETIVSDIQLS
jgi:hypothetical protein